MNQSALPLPEIRYYQDSLGRYYRLTAEYVDMAWKGADPQYLEIDKADFPLWYEHYRWLALRGWASTKEAFDEARRLALSVLNPKSELV